MTTELATKEMSIETLREMYSSLQFFDEDFNPLTEKWEEAQINPETRTQLLLEMLFVNRVQTISKNINWVVAHKNRSEFQQNIYKNKLTCPSTQTDEFGNVKGFGMKMSPEEWNLYEQFHNEVFLMEEIDA